MGQEKEFDEFDNCPTRSPQPYRGCACLEGVSHVFELGPIFQETLPMNFERLPTAPKCGTKFVRGLRCRFVQQGSSLFAISIPAASTLSGNGT